MKALSIIILLLAVVGSSSADVPEEFNAEYLAVDLIGYVHYNHGFMPRSWAVFLSWTNNNERDGRWSRDFLEKLGTLAWAIDVKKVPVGTKLIVVKALEYKKYEDWLNSYLWQYLQNEGRS